MISDNLGIQSSDEWGSTIYHDHIGESILCESVTTITITIQV